MLQHIYIHNFVIVNTLELEFTHGMTTITGETGAGKSILLEALSLALGARAETHMIRQGTKRCEITATFYIESLPQAQKWLTEQELHLDIDNNNAKGEIHQCILRRVISSDGRSRAYINDQPCTLQRLRELSSFLINMHSQHEHHGLLKRDKQRQRLDEFSGNLTLCHNISKIYHDWHDISQKLDALKNQQQEKETRTEFLKYQLQEFKKLDLQDNELNLLEEEYQRLSNIQSLQQACYNALMLTSHQEEHAAASLLYQAKEHIEPFKNLDKNLEASCELINQAMIYTQEAANTLQPVVDQSLQDPERLQWIDNRMTAIHDLARKHRMTPALLGQHQATIEEELNILEDSDEQLSFLENKLLSLEEAYRKTANQLTQKRLTAAKKLSKKITEEIQGLGLKGCLFSIVCHPNDDTLFSAHGLEQIEFLVSTNPGQPLQPLNKIVSGGELSRISLGIQVTTAQVENTPTLIFDEVDVGIGGSTAETVGQLLRRLSERVQVLCVTHLPQVAAQGHQQLKVSKQSKKHNTLSMITQLDVEERTSEIARMLGGIKITDQTLAHAKEMLDMQ